MPIIIGRKKKDTAGIADVASGKSKSYVTISRRTVNPQTGSKISKGSRVTMTPTKRMVGSTSISVPSGVSSSPGGARVTSRFAPADYNAGKVNIRPTVAAHAEMHGEHPAKVAARMTAQSEGRTSYAHPVTGTHELAGVRTDTMKTTPSKVTIGSKTITAPSYATGSSLKINSPKAGNSGVKLKPRAVTFGGSTKSGAPATKYGVGLKNKVVITRKVR